MNQKRIQQTADPRMKIFGTVAVLLVVIGAIFIFLGDGKGNDENEGIPKLKISEKSYDFGDISMANGLAKHNFEIKNEGDGILEISNISTSCMCTTVTLEINGKKSPEFGMSGHGSNPVFWSEKINPGETAILEATFDPLAHGPNATGPITREIMMTSNNNGEEKTISRIIFSGNVIK
ncbi:MAG: DUF1573 domain-containing protein [Patescibacteria group bacterium]|nr:DUF1573 domain-containing protein [Patescibacteria group bacterium]